MKVIVINGSPSMDKGNTALILEPFMEGMKEAGAEVEVFYTKKLKIRPCDGDLSCWLKTPGRCIHRDDMDWLLPKLGESDLLVLSIPLYVDGMPGPAKNLIDRMVPRGDMRIEIRDGRCRHPIREGLKPLPLALVCSLGFWEVEHCEHLVSHMKAWGNNANSPFLGAVLRPTGNVFKGMVESGMPFDDIFQAAREAGRQIITEGKMSSETLATISRPLMPREEFIEIHNAKVNEMLAEAAAKQDKGATA
jgi:putative NADPH-quinone reductase